MLLRRFRLFRKKLETGAAMSAKVQQSVVLTVGLFTFLSFPISRRETAETARSAMAKGLGRAVSRGAVNGKRRHGPLLGG